jgi:hypothetical protein
VDFFAATPQEMFKINQEKKHVKSNSYMTLVDETSNRHIICKQKGFVTFTKITCIGFFYLSKSYKRNYLFSVSQNYYQYLMDVLRAHGEY